MEPQRRDIQAMTAALSRVSASMDRMATALFSAVTQMEELAEILKEIPEEPEEEG